MARDRLNLPDTASVATPGTDGKLHAPSASRNAAAIRDVIAQFTPITGRALEIASGTGQHITDLGHAFPNLQWQPSDVDELRLASIAAWQKTSGSSNVVAPLFLDATNDGWGREYFGYNLILTVNLLHLISTDEAQTLVREAASALTDNGILMIYGPFLRGQEFASQGDRDFHLSLTAKNCSIGYKSFQDIQRWQLDLQLTPIEPIDMPANNLMLVARKSGHA